MSPTPPDASETNRIQAIDNTVEIVHALRDMGWTGVSELSKELDLPKSTTHVYLSTLHDVGYLTKRDGKYRLGLRFLETGGYVRHHSDIFQVARQEVDRLSNETGEVANLGVEEDGKRVLLYSAEPPEGIFDNSPTGQFKHMHLTALGKALLAQLPDDRVEAIVSRHGLPAATENSITDRESLFEEVDAVRRRGYSIEDEEHHDGIQSIGVPVRYADDPSLPTAVSISGPKSRIGNDIEGLLAEIQSAVNVIELEYEHY